MIISAPLQKAVACMLTVAIVGLLLLAWTVTEPLFRWSDRLRRHQRRRARGYSVFLNSQTRTPQQIVQSGETREKNRISQFVRPSGL